MRYLASLTFALTLLGTGAAWAGPTPNDAITEHPANIRVQVSPEAVERGGSARITVTLDPVEGVKVNRYPKIRLSVPASPGLVSAAEVSLGDDRPAPVDQEGGNYFDAIEPLTLDLALDRQAPSGKHEIDGQLVFYYCVKKSGFCAPKKTPLKIALDVR